MHLQARPLLSYVVLGLNLSVYAAGLAVRFGMGESSGEDYFYMLAKVNDEVTHGEYYRYDPLFAVSVPCSCCRACQNGLENMVMNSSVTSQCLPVRARCVWSRVLHT